MSAAHHAPNCLPILPIVIIGGGFCGATAAVHLLGPARQAGRRVLLIDRSAAFARGLAYRHHDDNQLLNVPAGNMSALAAQPGHFLEFCQAIDPAFNAGSFVSRRLYGGNVAVRARVGRKNLAGALQLDQDSQHPQAHEGVDGGGERVHGWMTGC